MHFVYINNDLDGISFGQDTEGKWGYIPSGADTVIPFKNFDKINNIVIENIISNQGETYASISKTSNKECILGISYHSVGNKISPTIYLNGSVIKCSFWSFGLYNNPTTLINVKNGDIISANFSGPAGQYDYYYICIGEFIFQYNS